MAKQLERRTSGSPRAARRRPRRSALAERLGLPYVDLARFRVDTDLFRSIPFDLMLRYNFVPEQQAAGRAWRSIVADPTDVVRARRARAPARAAARGQGRQPRGDRTRSCRSRESTQRVLDEATEDFRIQLVPEDEEGEETLTIDSHHRRTPRRSSSSSTRSSSTPSSAAPPTSTSRRATTRSSSSTASTACSTRRWSRSTSGTTRRSSRASRSCPSSTSPRSASRRTAASSCACSGRTIDFRVSIMPSVHGEDCVIRILDKESSQREFKSLQPRRRAASTTRP